MDHMEYSIALPPCVELTNAGVEWTTMKQRLFIHLNPNSFSYLQSPPNLSTAFLINISLEQVRKIFNLHGLSIEETERFNNILKSIEDICLPRFLIIYNRYRFFTCKQNGPEFNGFLQQLLAWSDLCEFGDLKDILLKDCIISGISEESVRQHLLRTEQLDFDKTVEICKAGLVKKYGNEIINSRCNSYKDVWTETDHEISHIIANKGLSNDRVDESTSTQIETKEKGTQTEEFSSISHTNFQVIEENQNGHNGLFSDSIIKNCIDTHPLFINDYERDANKNHVVQSHCEALDLPEHMEEEVTADASNKTDIILAQNAGQSHIGMGIEMMSNTNIDKSNSLDCSAGMIQSLSHHVRFSDEQHLQEHNKLHFKGIETVKLKCTICSLTFSDATSLRNHKAKHSHSHQVKDKVKTKKRFKCESCSSTFNTAAHLRVHSRLHTGERPFVCDTCGKGYAEASKLKIHVRNHTGERPYKCPDCNMTFKWSAAFSRHQRTHTGERPYECKHCNTSFADITSLQRHARTHTKDRPYMCMCGSSFSDPSALRVHKRIHTGERPHTCSICNASFIRAQHLKEHSKLHSGDKPHECKTCHAQFSEASKLKSHMRKHTGEKPYLCKICGRGFSWTAAYNRHLRTHTLEKPYVCRVCGCAFADNSSLTRHRRTHTGERPFPCTQCTSTFVDSSSLNRHMKIHTGEKAFTCDICGAAFAVKSYLDRHLQTHSGEKRFECDICASRFSESSKLKRHKKIHAKANMNVKQEKTKVSRNWETNATSDPSPLNPDLNQMQVHDIGDYLSKPLQLDPTSVTHEFGSIPVASNVLDAILNIDA